MLCKKGSTHRKFQQLVTHGLVIRCAKQRRGLMSEIALIFERFLRFLQSDE